MDEFDATGMLFNRIKSIDPENASKIMGYLLIQDVKEKDLLRLVSGPDTLLQAVIFRARTHLGLSSSSLSTPTSPSPNPFSRFNNNSNDANNNVKDNPFAQLSPRITNNGFLDFGKNSSLSDPKSSPFLSFDNIRSGSCLIPSVSRVKNDVGGDSSNSSGNSGNDFMEELQFNDYLSFLDESSKNEDFIDPRSQFSREVSNWGQDVNNGDIHLHRRSFSASDVCFGAEDPSFNIGYRPCLYFARGFCKNGDGCKFVHGGFGDNVDGNGVIVGSPNKMDGLYLQHEEMLRIKAAQQQRLAASQFAAGVSHLPYDKCMDLLLQQQNDPQRAAAAALMLGDEFYKFGQARAERNDFLAMGLAEKVNSANRQIYLTFPADSTFKDEDVSNYFSIFGPVQDVRIPYQQKRMFGFVTFVYPETVKLILARGNPHFICDSRVLVKPYKEKGKIVDRKQQQFERGNMSPCSSPSGVDSRDPYDLRFGSKMLYHSQELMLRRKLEQQAELQQAIEFQRRRLLNLQLPNLKNHAIHHHQRSLSVGSPVNLAAHTDVNQNVVLPSVGINQNVLEGDNATANKSTNVTAATEQHSQSEVNAASILNNGSKDSKEESSKPEEYDLHERFECYLHISDSCLNHIMFCSRSSGLSGFGFLLNFRLILTVFILCSF
ncbi:Zinc finger CCCH domain-containing protein [Melia azedarach]|uniref:Zinc finger CCCH domain-containing protein n=1 Tax=Melia azedarach TaxID=155640 RepID=A0ACC1YLT7_MELAZ|nr:Zinc finger CCCH domain-containing protein [Melia azedarach]